MNDKDLIYQLSCHGAEDTLHIKNPHLRGRKRGGRDESREERGLKMKYFIM